MTAAGELPFHIVSGFLGAGKTTLINSLLKSAELSGTLVIVNEFGAVGLDHLLYERMDGDVALLSSGCLCCQLRGDLVELLSDLLSRRDAGALAPFSRIVIETSGLADPAPILHALIADPVLARRLALSGVVTLVDAVNGLATLDAHPEARRQLALADAVAITKRDLAGDVTKLEAHIREINPAARLLDRIAPQDFLSVPLVTPAAQRATRLAAHGGGARAFTFAYDQPLSELRLSRFFEALTRLAGPKLLRIKGLALTETASGRPLVIEGAQHLVHAPRRLDGWPFHPAETRLVAIVDGLTPSEVNSLWRALSDAPEIDRPDLTALLDNPLAPRPGGLFD